MESPNLSIEPPSLLISFSNIPHFRQYFGNLHHVSVPGRTYPVEEFFLEKVLVR